jgi:hypothetical protein
MALAIDVHPVLQGIAAGYLIDIADELARCEILGVVAFFEIVELLKDGDRDYYIMLFKIFYRGVVVNYNGSVKYEDLFVFLHIHDLKEHYPKKELAKTMKCEKALQPAANKLINMALLSNPAR